MSRIYVYCGVLSEIHDSLDPKTNKDVIKLLIPKKKDDVHLCNKQIWYIQEHFFLVMLFDVFFLMYARNLIKGERGLIAIYTKTEHKSR